RLDHVRSLRFSCPSRPLVSPRVRGSCTSLVERATRAGASLRLDRSFRTCLHAPISSFLPALVAFAATPGNDVSQIIAAVIVGNLHTWPDVLEGAYDDPVAYDVCLGIGPALMICISSKILSARSVNRPTAVDLVKIAVASGLKFIGLLVRLATFVFDNEDALL